MANEQPEGPAREGLTLAQIDFVRDVVLRAPLRFAAVAALTCAAYFAWSMSSPPSYRSTAKLRVEDVAAKSPQLEHRAIPGGTVDEGEALTALRSRTLLARVVAEPGPDSPHGLGLTTWVTDETAAPLARALRRLLVGPVDPDVRLAARATPESASAPTEVRMRFKGPDEVALETVGAGERHPETRRFEAGRHLVYRGLRLELDPSGPVDGRPWRIEVISEQAAIDRVARALRVDKQQHQPGTLGLTVTDEDAARAAAIADAVARTFVEEDHGRSADRAAEKARYLSEELVERRADLDALEDERARLLATFPDAVAPEAAAAELAKREGAWDDRHRRARAERLAAERALELMNAGAEPRAALASLSGGIPDELVPLRDALGVEEQRLRNVLQGSTDTGYRRTLLLKSDDYRLEAQTFATRVEDLTRIIEQLEDGDDSSLARLGGDLAREGSISVDWNIRLWLTELQEARDQLERLRREFKDSAPRVIATERIVAHYREEILAGLRAQLRGLTGTLRQKEQYAEYWRELFDRFPEDEAALISASVAEIKREIVTTFAAYVAGKRFEEERAAAEQERLRERVQGIAAARRELARTGPEREQLERVVGDLLRDIENAEIAAAGVEPSARIVDPATLPRGRTKPRAGFGLVAGTVLGLLVALLQAWMAAVHRRPPAAGAGPAEADLPDAEDLPTLGAVPLGPGPAGDGRSLRLLGSRRAKDALWLPMLEAPHSDAAFDHRLLRERLCARLEGPAVVGLVAGAGGAGTSTVALNLAVGLAQVGRRVLLVDGDLRAPRLGRAVAAADLFREGEQAHPIMRTGLAEALDGRRPWRASARTAHAPALDFLDAGSSLIAPADLFHGRRFERFVEAARGAYDVVVLDLPAADRAPDVLAAAAARLDGWVVVGERGAALTAAAVEEHGGVALGLVRCLGAGADADARDLRRSA